MRKGPATATVNRVPRDHPVRPALEDHEDTLEKMESLGNREGLAETERWDRKATRDQPDYKESPGLREKVDLRENLERLHCQPRREKKENAACLDSAPIAAMVSVF